MGTLLRCGCRPVTGRLPELLSQLAEPAHAILESIGDVHISATEEVALDSWVRGAR